LEILPSLGRKRMLRRSIVVTGSGQERIWIIEIFYIQGETGERTGEEEIVSHQISLRQSIVVGSVKRGMEFNPCEQREEVPKE
jgi:hypothetical protein